MAGGDDDEDNANASVDGFPSFNTSYATASSQLDSTVESSSQIDCYEDGVSNIDHNEMDGEFGTGGGFDDDEGSIVSSSRAGSGGYSLYSDEDESIEGRPSDVSERGVAEYYFTMISSEASLMQKHMIAVMKELYRMQSLAQGADLPHQFNDIIAEMIEHLKTTSGSSESVKYLLRNQYSYFGDDALAELESQAETNAEGSISAWTCTSNCNASCVPPRTQEPETNVVPSSPPSGKDSSCPSTPQTPVQQRSAHPHMSPLLQTPRLDEAQTPRPILEEDETTDEAPETDEVADTEEFSSFTSAEKPMEDSKTVVEEGDAGDNSGYHEESDSDSEPEEESDYEEAPPKKTKAAPKKKAANAAGGGSKCPRAPKGGKKASSARGGKKGGAKSVLEEEDIGGGDDEGSPDVISDFTDNNDEEIDSLSLCNDVSARLVASGDRSLVVAGTLLLRTIRRLVQNIFNNKQPNSLRLIDPLTNKVLEVLASLSQHNQHLSARYGRDAGDLAKVPNFSEDRHGDILIKLDTATKAREKTEEPPEVTEALSKLSDALKELRGLKKPATNDQMKRFVRIGTSMMYTIQHLLHLCMFCCAISELTMHQVHWLLDEEFLERARKLSALVNPEFQFNENTTVLAYIENILLRGLASTIHWQLAAQVMCDIKLNITDTANDTRAETLLRPFKKPRWGKYCDHRTNGCKKRLRMTTISFCLLGQEAIRRRVADDSLFSARGGFVPCLFRLSPDLTYEHCRELVTSEFFQSEEKRAKVVSKVRKNAVEQGRRFDKEFNSGKCNIVIEGKKPIQSLQELIRTAMSGEQ